MEDQEIRSLLSRLARPHASGGQVIERAAILAEGAEFPAIMAWITAHAGQPEATTAPSSVGGLHSSRMNEGGEPDRRAPQRYVLPTATLG
ncbi:MAG: hypothetical protein DLM64_06900 [Solirubrobacterales bacterium]|nr:MAG: hypothetical protein DLM64_06900 [Solirubrobacterales bacterium]